MWQNQATGAIRKISHRPPESATVPEWYLRDLHLTCELSKFEVKIIFEILQLSPTPISLKFAATQNPTLV